MTSFSKIFRELVDANYRYIPLSNDSDLVQRLVSLNFCGLPGFDLVLKVLFELIENHLVVLKALIGGLCFSFGIVVFLSDLFKVSE